MLFIATLFFIINLLVFAVAYFCAAWIITRTVNAYRDKQGLPGRRGHWPGGLYPETPTWYAVGFAYCLLLGLPSSFIISFSGLQPITASLAAVGTAIGITVAVSLVLDNKRYRSGSLLPTDETK